MTKARLVQLRVPEEIIRRIDRFVAEGLYRSRSEVIVDATRRFLEKSAPSTAIEQFIDSYMAGTLKPSENATENIRKLFEKLRKDPSWRVQYGNTPEEVIRKLRSRAG
jgi:Arc/MetJ-type ribon-helix-helix transcriptional regulator